VIQIFKKFISNISTNTLFLFVSLTATNPNDPLTNQGAVNLYFGPEAQEGGGGGGKGGRGAKGAKGGDTPTPKKKRFTRGLSYGLMGGGILLGSILTGLYVTKYFPSSSSSSLSLSGKMKVWSKVPASEAVEMGKV
jgi:hypothetical protein